MVANSVLSICGMVGERRNSTVIHKFESLGEWDIPVSLYIPCLRSGISGSDQRLSKKGGRIMTIFLRWLLICLYTHQAFTIGLQPIQVAQTAHVFLS